VAPLNFVDWRAMNRTFAEMAATAGRVATITGDGPPEEVPGRLATPSFFGVLGVPPLLGRTFTDAEDRDNAQVVVISHTLWQRRYGGDPAIVGRGIVMNNQTYSVIGVMPQLFAYRNRDVDYWMPIGSTLQQRNGRTSHNLNVVGRMKSGVSIEAAQADMTNVARTLAEQYPDTNTDIGAIVVPVREEILGNADVQLVVLMAAAALVLLIACANLASLLLSRALGRRNELAIRAALGASRARLVRQMVVEGLLLSLTGGLLGIGLAHFGAALVSDLAPAGLARQAGAVSGAWLELDPRVLAFTFAIAVATGLLFSLLPALHTLGTGARNVRLQPDLGSRGAIGSGSRVTRDGLVVFQIALAVVLLAATGLMIRTLINLRRIDVGFNPAGLLTMRTSLPFPKYQEANDRVSFWTRVVAGVEALPGVERAAYGYSIPFTTQGNTTWFGIEGVSEESIGRADATLRAGTPGYLQTLGATLIEGRVLDERDGPDAPRAVVINETMKRLFFPDGSPIGHRMQFSNQDRPFHVVVGVVKDISERGYLAEAKPGVYLSVAQAPESWAVPEYLVVRAARGVDPASLADSARRVVVSIDADQPVSLVRPMEDILASEIADRHQQMVLFGAFAALALGLATIGLYGLLAYLVSQRSREIGLRMALGAPRGSIVALVAGHGLVLAGVGLGMGVVMAVAATRVLRSSLYGIGANDPATFTLAVGVLGVVAAIASAIPAVRAAQLDPMIVLREE
jgi:predicted permease